MHNIFHKWPMFAFTFKSMELVSPQQTMFADAYDW